MTAKTNSLLPSATSYALGLVILYVFICFYGVVFAFVIDSGTLGFFYKSICKINEVAIRRFLYFSMESMQFYFLLFILISLFVYFPINFVSQKPIKHSFLLVLGAVTCDILLYVFIHKDIGLGFIFAVSFIFDNELLAVSSNLVIWFILSWLAIKSAYFTRTRIRKKT